MRIGTQTGYMLTKYLLKGKAVNQQQSALQKKTGIHPLTAILWDDTHDSELLSESDMMDMYVVGVYGDVWYLVWEPSTGRYGRIMQTDLGDGNG